MAEELNEAQRCLKCRKPFCKEACPVQTDIPRIMNLFLEGKIDECGEILFDNNPLTAFCSKICPHERNCYGHCILNKKGAPIKFYVIEQYISNYYLTKAKLQKPAWNGHRVAIIGSGPAGLSLSILLAKKGYKVTMFESKDKIGGVLRYGIPEFRLPKKMLDNFLDRMNDLGIMFRPNTWVGTAITVDDMFRDGYDAIFIGTGVWKPNAMHIPGESLGNVHFAIDYLKNTSAYKQLGNHVCIVGAGNVAMDAARTVLRTTDAKVDIIYRKGEEDAPALKEELEFTKMDGAKMNFYLSPEKIVDDGIFVAPVEKVTHEDGTVEYVTHHDQAYKIECSSVIIAVGQGPNSNIVRTASDINTNKKGLVATDEKGSTTKEGVFAGGDVVSGAKTVVEAVAASKVAAEEIDNYIKNKYNEK